eukprot:g10484.t1
MWMCYGNLCSCICGDQALQRPEKKGFPVNRCEDLPSKTEAKMEAGGAEGLRFFLIRGPLLLAVRVLPQDI